MAAIFEFDGILGGQHFLLDKEGMSTPNFMLVSQCALYLYYPAPLQVILCGVGEVIIFEHGCYMSAFGHIRTRFINIVTLR